MVHGRSGSGPDMLGPHIDRVRRLQTSLDSERSAVQIHTEECLAIG